MGSQGAYAGQPHSFACAKCRRSRNFYNHVTQRTSETIGRRFKTTGRTRKQLSNGMNYHRWPNVAYEYTCLGCGHVGWSRHPSVKIVYDKEHGTDE